MDKGKGKAYAAVALETLFTRKKPINAKNLTKQMEIAYDLYEEDEIDFYYNKVLEKNENNDDFKQIEDKVNYCYIVNVFESSSQQKDMIEKFCKNSNIDLRKIYIAPTGRNTDKFYELIKDIRARAFDILIVTIFSVYAVPDEEWAIIVKLCRQNDIQIIEI